MDCYTKDKAKTECRCENPFWLHSLHLDLLAMPSSPITAALSLAVEPCWDWGLGMGTLLRMWLTQSSGDKVFSRDSLWFGAKAFPQADSTHLTQPHHPTSNPQWRERLFSYLCLLPC